LFAALREPPLKGSLRESVLLLYALKREEIQYMRDLAVAQIMVSKEKGAEVFDKYTKTMFPWMEVAKNRDDEQHKKILEQIVKAGPLTVVPMQEKKGKSRLVQRRETKSGPLTPEQKKKQNELYKKLGKSIPT
jgi:hypothetical protein